MHNRCWTVLVIVCCIGFTLRPNGVNSEAVHVHDITELQGNEITVTPLPDDKPLIKKIGIQKADLGDNEAKDAIETVDIHVWDVMSQAVEVRAAHILEDDVASGYQISQNVSTPCRTHMALYLAALQNEEIWAQRMFDSMGKPASGIMEFNVNWLGNWEECLNVEAPAVNQGSVSKHPFVGKYCRASFMLRVDTGSNYRRWATLSVGMCFPDSCSQNDATLLANSMVKLLPVNFTRYLGGSWMSCQEDDPEWTKGAIIALCVVAAFAVIMLAGTSVDIYIRLFNSTQTVEMPPVNIEKYTLKTLDGCLSTISNGKTDEKLHDIEGNKQEIMKIQANKPGLISKVLIAFSVISNGEKILNRKQPAGTLTCLHGIRFIGMTWVIMGHSYQMSMSSLDNGIAYTKDVLGSLTFQAVSNAYFAVDTFFVLSGLLVTYLTLREMNKVGGALKTNWFMFYFHRIWRLTPVYMLFMMVYASLSPYWGDGPRWNQSGLGSGCAESWWRYILYINNLDIFDEPAGCMGWAWYLAADMQFYVISPLFVIALFYSKKAGTVLCLLGLLATIVTTGKISYDNEFGATTIYGNNVGDSYTKMYYVPWCRIGPYLVGIYTGFLLYKTKCNVNISKLYNTIGWTVAIVVGLLVVYGLYSGGEQEDSLSTTMAAVYNATSRSAWGMCVAWMVFSCATGHGGPVNKILSWDIFIPLSRLAYCAYLIHPIVIFSYNNSLRVLIHGNDITMAYLYLGHTCISYGLAFILSLTFEAPMMALEKVILGRGKSS